MTDQYAVAAGGSWSAATTWKSAPLAGDDTGPPANTDDAYLTSSSGDILVDAGQVDQCLSLITTGYTGTITHQITLLIAGSATIGAGTTFAGTAGAGLGFYATSGTPTLTTGGEVLPDLIVNNSGVTSFILQDALECESFKLTAGKFDDGGNDVSVGGAVTVTAGTFTSTGTWTMTGTADLTTASATKFGKLVIDTGATVTQESTYYTQCLALDVKGTLSEGAAAGYIYINLPADNFYACSGTNNCGLMIRANTDISTGAGITLGNKDLDVRCLNPNTELTADGNIDLGTGTLTVRAEAGSTGTSLTTGAFGVTCQGIVIGGDAATKETTWHMGTGTHNIGSGGIVQGQDDQEGANVNTLAFDSCILNLTGTIDGDEDDDAAAEIAGTNTNAVVHGGTIANLVVTGTVLDASDDVTDGGGNTNIDFNDGSGYPNRDSACLCGCGR